MAINGTHMLFYTSEAEQLRATLRDVFGFKHVDAGGGWLIFRLPPSEVGVHPAEGPTYDSGVRHQISFMCDDMNKTIADLRAKGIAADEPKTESYGITTTLHLPGGCDVMMYEPRHAIAADIIGVGTRVARMPAPKKKVATALKGRPAKKAARRR
jgi:hypothetical protein